MTESAKYIKIVEWSAEDNALSDIVGNHRAVATGSL